RRRRTQCGRAREESAGQGARRPVDRAEKVRGGAGFWQNQRLDAVVTEQGEHRGQLSAVVGVGGRLRGRGGQRGALLLRAGGPVAGGVRGRQRNVCPGVGAWLSGDAVQVVAATALCL